MSLDLDTPVPRRPERPAHAHPAPATVDDDDRPDENSLKATPQRVDLAEHKNELAPTKRSRRRREEARLEKRNNQVKRTGAEHAHHKVKKATGASVERSRFQQEVRLVAERPQASADVPKNTTLPHPATIRLEGERHKDQRQRVAKHASGSGPRRKRERTLPASLMPKHVDVAETTELGARRDGTTIWGAVIAS